MKESLMRLAYPRYDEAPERFRSRIAALKAAFAAQFGGGEPRIFTAPGRVEVGGNHTDHQHGCVLAAAIDMDMLSAARPNGTDEIRILSEGYPMFKVSAGELAPQSHEYASSSSIVRGMAAGFAGEGCRVRGFDAYIVSDVLRGSGLSSSAAFEVLIGAIMNGLFANGEVSAVRIAQLGQKAENLFFGKASGLMDQMASSVGGFAFMDFQDNERPVIEQIRFDFASVGYSLCIIDSGADHADLSAEYDTMPNEMKAVAACFGKRYLREVDYASFMAKLPEIRARVGDRAVLRAIHFFGENERAIAEAGCLKRGDFEAFLKILRESGRSSYMYLQNVTAPGAVREQAVAYALAVCDVLLGGRGGFRVHGGGFAGTVQAFVPNDMLNSFIPEAERLVGAGRCHVLSVRPMGGGELE